jgi:hypothetical protein
MCLRKKIPDSTHNGWSLFFGWGPTRNGFSMACRASATCFLSGHVASVNLGESRKIRFRADQVDMSKVAYGSEDKSKLARDNQEAPCRYPGLKFEIDTIPGFSAYLMSSHENGGCFLGYTDKTRKVTI